ncbi:MAG: sigma-54 interaction domain-containing protein [Ignavibacteriales bacterium]
MWGVGGLRETAQQVSSAIAAVLGLEVEVVDEDLIRIAGTGKYRSRVGQSLEHEGAAYKRVMATGRGMLVLTPGKESICQECPSCGTCEEKAELSAPILVEGKAVGVIGLICFDEEQRQRLMARIEHHQNFISHMAGLLAGKVMEVRLWEEERLAAQEIKMLLDRISDPVVAVDRDGRLVHCNLPAGRLLGIESHGEDRPAGEQRLSDQIEGLAFLNGMLATQEEFEEKEMFLDFGQGEKPYLVSAAPLRGDGDVLGAMATFRPLAELHRWAYNLTQAEDSFALDGIVGSSEAIRRLKEKALKVAGSRSTVLILGESGTGKELVARGIHHSSPRAGHPFIVVNCAAIPDELLESELFGYDEGAFTGARRQGKPGKFELADTGTLFLDEIGDMPLHLQGKLLRVLQDKEVERLGGTRPRPVDVRVIAATNRDLKDKIAHKEFREDLYFRLNVIPLVIPPLRDRPEDIVLLARHFTAKYGRVLGKRLVDVSGDALGLLEAYPWPGNVRELENAIEYAANLETSPVIRVPSLPEAIRIGAQGQATGPSGGQDLSLAAMEARLIREALSRHGTTYRGKCAAARDLGIGIATLYRKMNLHGGDLSK